MVFFSLSTFTVDVVVVVDCPVIRTFAKDEKIRTEGRLDMVFVFADEHTHKKKLFTIKSNFTSS
jgi:hypothetical protein